MSFSDGMAALRLEAPATIPRTEYSAETHWALVSRVTGIPVDEQSSPEEQTRARDAFVRAWNYGMVWNVWVHEQIFGDLHTRMGHAVYAAGGVDYDTRVSCPFSSVEEVLAFDPVQAYGPVDQKAVIAALNADYASARQHFPDAVTMTGSYVTCVSGLISVFGWEMLLEACGEDPDGFGEVTNRYGAFIRPYFEALAACDAPVIMVHDDICWTEGQIFRTEWYRRYVFPNLKRCISLLREAGKIVLFTSDGNYTMFLDDIADAGANGFVMEPCTDLRVAAEKFGKTHVLVGNADTRILLSGSREDIRNEVKRCMDIGRDCPGFIMAVGNHIPANTPVENALYYDACYRELAKR